MEPAVFFPTQHNNKHPKTGTKICGLRSFPSEANCTRRRKWLTSPIQSNLFPFSKQEHFNRFKRFSFSKRKMYSIACHSMAMPMMKETKGLPEKIRACLIVVAVIMENSSAERVNNGQCARPCTWSLLCIPGPDDRKQLRHSIHREHWHNNNGHNGPIHTHTPRR